MRLSKYLRAIFVPALIVVAPIIIPLFRVSFNSGDILGPTTFIFSILAGFFIADATANYRRLRQLILTENATLSYLYYITLRENPQKANKLADAIDEYMIAQLDYNLLDHTEHTRDEFNKVVSISKMIPRLDKSLYYLILGNHEIFLSAKKTIGRNRWFLIVSLAIVIAFLLLLKRTGDPLLSLLIGIVLASIYQILKLLYDLDNNRYLADKLGYKTPQRVFESIDKLPYYPETAIKNNWAKAEKPYRVGVYKNYPKSFDKDIKIVKK